MTTTPVEETQAPAQEQTESAPESDELIHKPESDITSTDSLPKSDPTPKTDSPPGDVKSEPEAGKEPEAKQEEAAAPTLETLAADVTTSRTAIKLRKLGIRPRLLS